MKWQRLLVQDEVTNNSIYDQVIPPLHASNVQRRDPRSTRFLIGPISTSQLVALGHDLLQCILYQYTDHHYLTRLIADACSLTPPKTQPSSCRASRFRRFNRMIRGR